MANFYTLVTSIIICAILAGYRAHGQQLYCGDAEPEVARNNSGSDICLGYYNNGPASCKTKLIFRSQYPYNTLSRFASLLNVDIDDLTGANPNYSIHGEIERNKLVYAPVTCSSDSSVSPYYFKTTSHIVGPADTCFHLANDTYQGLVTCKAIRFMNGIEQDPSNFAIGKSLILNFRCACPTINQQTKGITSLDTYGVWKGDTISSISRKSGVDIESILEANGLSNKSVVYPFTTLLIPVTEYDRHESPSSTNSSSETTPTAIPATTNTNSFTVRIKAIVIGVCAAIALVLGVIGGVYLGCCNSNTIFCCCSRQNNRAANNDREDEPPLNNGSNQFGQGNWSRRASYRTG